VRRCGGAELSIFAPEFHAEEASGAPILATPAAARGGAEDRESTGAATG
jgi:hypothetical protein